MAKVSQQAFDIIGVNVFSEPGAGAGGTLCKLQPPVCNSDLATYNLKKDANYRLCRLISAVNLRIMSRRVGLALLCVPHEVNPSWRGGF